MEHVRNLYLNFTSRDIKDQCWGPFTSQELQITMDGLIRKQGWNMANIRITNEPMKTNFKFSSNYKERLPYPSEESSRYGYRG